MRSVVQDADHFPVPAPVGLAFYLIVSKFELDFANLSKGAPKNCLNPNSGNVRIGGNLRLRIVEQSAQ